MIRVTPHITIPEDEIQMDFVRASGPGGQNVNKVSTSVQLRFDALRSQSLSEEVRTRLLKIAGRKATTEGVIVIEAKRYRSQDKNRRDALDRLAALIRSALHEPRKRRPTKPTAGSREERLKEKKRRSGLKQSRRIREYGQE